MAEKTSSARAGLAILCILVFVSIASAAKVDPALSKQLSTAASTAKIEAVVTYFNMPSSTDVAVLTSLGITTGIRYQALPIIAVLATPAQISRIATLSNVRSVWGNTQFQYYLKDARPLIGLERLQTNGAITRRNGGLPVSGRGIGIAIVDGGVDGSHADIKFDPLHPAKVVQNVKVEGRLLDTGIGAGIVPDTYVENLVTTDNTSGHGSFVASCAAGLGSVSGGVYRGMAPGASIIGLGAGETIVVINALAAFDYVLTHQFQYNIRIVNNSWGGDAPLDPDNPTSVAFKTMHDNNIVVVFAAGNNGPGRETLNIWARSPYVIGVGAGTKDGRLADFSSRGFPNGLPGNGAPAGFPPLPQNSSPALVAPGAALGGVRMAAGVNVIGALDLASGADDGTGNTVQDTSLPAAFLPFYTISSGTSFASPSLCGVAALVLEADPTLSSDEVKQILMDTATPMPGYAPWEVGAGYVNVAAAVDLAFNRSKPYGSFNNTSFRFNAQFPSSAQETPYHFDFMPAAPPGTFTKQFTVQHGAVDVLASMHYNGDPATGSNSLILNLFDPNGNRSFALTTPVLTPDPITVEVANPAVGTWTLEVSGFTPVGTDTNAALPDSIDGNIDVFYPTGNNVTDIAGRADLDEITRALIRRLMDTFPDNTFRPDQAVTRQDLGQTLILSGAVRQNLFDSTQFGDVPAAFSPMASALAATGSVLKDTYQQYPGVMARGASGASFFPNATVNRADLAVALVRALGLEQIAQARMNEDLSSRAIDAASIPADARGFVAEALDLGLLSTFPATVVEVSPGVFQAVPGPTFQPATVVTRAGLAAAINRMADNFFAGPATVR
jgi:serine protease AprX